MVTRPEAIFAVATLLWICGFINAQSDIKFETDDDSSSGDPNCRCTHVRRCRPLMVRPDWRDILPSLKTCGYRRICCPRTINSPPDDPKANLPPGRPITIPIASTSRPSIRPPPTTPPPITPLINEVTGSNLKACGQSKYTRPSGVMEDDTLRGLIMGGVNASQGEFPWMVAINIRERPEKFVAHCTGFMVDTTHVVTAAHCFDESMDPEMFLCKIGHILQTSATTYTVRRIVRHEGYTPGKYYKDVAVMTLTEPVNETNFNPICLPTENIMQTDLTGKGVTVAGWGSERFRGELTNHLKKLEYVPVISNQQCNRILRKVLANNFIADFPNGITSGFICAGFKEGNKDSCGGDSGGPLMLNQNNVYYVVGIVSFGVSCGRPGVPGGYTRVSSELNWITAHTSE